MSKKMFSKARKCTFALLLIVSMVAQSLSGMQDVFAAETVSVEINGYQVNVGLQAYRTIYSVVDIDGSVVEKGLVYGLADYASEEDMVVGSTNGTVYSYAATEKGLSSVNHSTDKNAESYVMTMKFIDSIAFYASKIRIRAYAKLDDGTYVYSDISTKSVYDIADSLYQDSKMRNEEEHGYLYDDILSQVNTSYEKVEYKEYVVEPGTTVEETTTEEPTAEETTVEETTTEEATTLLPLIGAENADWSSVDYLAGTAEPQYKVIVARGTVTEVVNVQMPGFATTEGIYTSYPDANFGTHTVNGSVLSCDVQGAGILMHLSNFVETYSTVVINYGDGTERAVLYVYNAKAGQEETSAPETTVVPETTTAPPETTEPETTTEAPTTEAVTEVPTAAPPTNINLDAYFAGIDTASSSTLGEGAETSDKLFDNNVNTKMFSGVAMNVEPIRVAWKMNQAVVLKNYTLTTANDSATYSYRNPLEWHLYGSNNATSWTQIDTVKGSGIGAVNYADYTYETDVQESFQYYLIQFESNGGYYGFQLAEISMHGDVSKAEAVEGEDLSQYFKGIAPGNEFGGYNAETPEKLFDDDTSTKMFTGESLPRALVWEMNRDVTLYSYSLTTANDNAEYENRLPKSWMLYGSADGNNWDVIDSVANSGMQNVNYTTYTYTVDKVGTYKYFKLYVVSGAGSSFQLSEIDLYGAVISPSEYDILLTGDWDVITSEDYVDELIKLFYNSYPRLYARFASGTEPKTITFMADKTYDGVAYCAGTTVCVSTAYANANPHDIGFFSHEITHSVQQYGGLLNYGDDVAWWTENMANYGGFRYFHWSNPRYVQVYEATDTSLQDWGYEQYGNNKWFFAYMDSRYPTTKNADGSLNYGLIDSINRLIKANNTGTTYTDDPYLVGSPFNNVVKQVTGYDCIESLRLRYVEELKAGTWTFTGFANYADNFLTENIEGVPNPEYPMLGEKTHGNKTAAELFSDITSGTNLCNGATIFDYSGFVNASESVSMLIDGNLGTKWCATKDNLINPTYSLNGVKHWVMLDLGSEKTFNTYTMYNTQSREGYGNATEWEILVSNDAKNWTSVDYQSYNNSAISSFDIGSQTARYVFIKVFTPDDGAGTLRLYEFQLYNR